MTRVVVHGNSVASPPRPPHVAIPRRRWRKFKLKVCSRTRARGRMTDCRHRQRDFLRLKRCRHQHSNSWTRNSNYWTAAVIDCPTKIGEELLCWLLLDGVSLHLELHIISTYNVSCTENAKHEAIGRRLIDCFKMWIDLATIPTDAWCMRAEFQLGWTACATCYCYIATLWMQVHLALCNVKKKMFAWDNAANYWITIIYP